jgi:putative nucleotidyltransferase with HDIG domain
MTTTTPTTPLLIRQLERLPANPTAAVRVLWLADDPNSSSEDLAAAVSTDPALTTRIMHMANSAYYGLSGKVLSSAFAITILGFSAVRTLAAAAAAGAVGQEGAVPEGFWAHAAATAAGAALVASRVGAPRNEAFSLGLLHDIGRALLHRVDPDLYASVHAASETRGTSLLEAERAAFGLDHTEAATRVLSAWRFPPEFVEAISDHHADVETVTSPLTRALVTGEALAALADHARCEDGRDAAEYEAVAVDVGGLDPSEIEGVVAHVRREADVLAGSFLLS